MPVTTPEVLTIALVESLLYQEPPEVEVVRVIVLPTQTVLPPEMVAAVLTVTVRVAMQLLPVLYDIVTTPVLTGVITPAELIVATAVLLLLQVPPAGDPAKVYVDPMQIALTPEIVPPAATVMFFTALHPPLL